MSALNVLAKDRTSVLIAHRLRYRKRHREDIVRRDREEQYQYSLSLQLDHRRRCHHRAEERCRSRTGQSQRTDGDSKRRIPKELSHAEHYINNKLVFFFIECVCKEGPNFKIKRNERPTMYQNKMLYRRSHDHLIYAVLSPSN